MRKYRIYFSMLMASVVVAVVTEWSLFASIAVGAFSLLVLFRAVTLLLGHMKAVKNSG